MADIFDVVADPTRRDLLSLLLARYVATDSDTGELRVGEIVQLLGTSQPTVSKHLKVLRDHGLVSVREEGQHRYYSLEATPLEALEDWLIPFLSADFDPSRIDPDDADASPAFTAWAGARVGSQVGRTVADRSYKATTALHNAQDRLSHGLRRITRR
ncbi:ArsR family transcriptional regulator [Glaciihabitans tibetensis]|uniref:ArsR family transcriptional regulator n=1 Tax=Glaciihabitans tibetensis TaxID=1266600 RepID=A0A2T0VA00_9MICO|nr:metalloregulator ArsR/SmtB family transcription factor [Glaciihabitans tibetensis]PRY67010.1 ArsR family transcriptional regulator [Glaciihabitans tibetensis]